MYYKSSSGDSIDLLSKTMVFSDWWITNLAHGWSISIRRAHWCRHYYRINCTLIFSRQITYVNYNCKHTSYGWKNRQEVSSKLLDKIRWLYIFFPSKRSLSLQLCILFSVWIWKSTILVYGKEKVVISRRIIPLYYEYILGNNNCRNTFHVTGNMSCYHFPM